jgi:Xaa-Pro aminopeptidase
MVEHKYFQQRRSRLARRMGRGVAIIPTSREVVRNHDSFYPYRFDSYFYYLTGFQEPESILVVVGGTPSRHILFCRDRNTEREIWDGHRFGPRQAKKAFGFREAYSIDKFDTMMPRLLVDQPAVYYAVGADKEWDTRISHWLNCIQSQSRSGVSAPGQLYDVRLLIDEMRLIKDTRELATMREAAKISAAAHCRVMQRVHPGMMEYEIEAELLHEFRRRGAQSPAYTPIVAGGANACILHYVTNNALLKDGDLLLIDAACELNGYASDLSRTFPVNGKFQGPQRDVYEMVLAAQTAAIEAVKPGHGWDKPHQTALKILARGMIDLGLCKGSVDAVLESGAYRTFYMHRTGHWLGLDVHDVGAYKANDKWQVFKPGMTLTVEPGCYIRPGKRIPKQFWNLGIRIEDDVLVTRSGREVLSAGAPKTVSEIEEWMGQARHAARAF